MLLGWAIANAAEVTLDGPTWAALQPPTPDLPPAPPPIWARRDVTLVPVGASLFLEATWTVWVAEPGWVSVPLAAADLRVSRATFDGQPTGITPEGEALVWTSALSAGLHRLVLAGTVDGNPEIAPLTLRLAPAAAGRAQISLPQGRVVPHADGSLSLSMAPALPPEDGATSARADVGLGLVIGEGIASFAARLTWTLERGALDQVAFEVPGAGADLQVTGTEIASWSRVGDQVSVVLVRPANRSVQVEARWTLPLAEQVAVPAVRALGARRTQGALQVARDGELEPVPNLRGWTAIASRELPEWADGLAPGIPVGSWTSPTPAGGTIAAVRFEPTAGPPVIVDVAAWDLALSDEGRLLLSGRLEVRNDRAAWLRVTPPPGARILSARVDGKTARIAGDDKSWWIPLARSVETVDGLLSFPVELVLLGSGTAWARGDQPVPLPVLDAPIAVTRASVRLPAGWRSRNRVGEGYVVPAFSEGDGITYGLATGASVAVADALYQVAVDAWKSNDFDEAQAAIDDVRALGGDNENMRRLEGNLMLVTGKETGEVGAAERRLLDQAKARSLDDVVEQEKLLEEAKKMEFAGKYDEAEEAYRDALTLGSKLQRLDNSATERAAQQVELDQKVVALKAKVPAGKSSVTLDPSPDFPSPAALPPQDLPVLVSKDSESEGETRSAGQRVPDPAFRMQVTATTTAVVIPELGETLRFQQLLLPAATPPRFEIRARAPRSP